MLITFIVLIAGICAILGASVGYFSRGKVVVEVLLSAGVSALLFICLSMISGSFTAEWSFEKPLTGAAYLILPYLLVFFLPTVAASLLAGWLRK